ncbi:N-acetylmuramoyl-L-alanine amidase [Roseovarius halotolerans]|uniref:N-acetylmuramoyl-L-alanine amidase n=1 Tax=Roseovarius halotolerans TaxID=505353 RepID=A0A1X6YKX7_9RHOB|nr:N-acetylmuramoyl-L-alanine amidase [Roseovarius halotolerans]RKT34363.1 N-acetylmuramoyl-L-alanine amidase [Roseovarius halotolerans]SLN24425.1 N-acetylmuramoyl-L-alanine amidase AmiA precursor [Roseovarius halotolerans]
MIRIVLAGLLGLWAGLAMAQARDFSGLARVDMQASEVRAGEGGVVIALGLSQGVPYRIFTLDAPERLVLDFREVDWSGVEPGALIAGAAVKDVRVGGFRPGWSRMVVDLAGPMAVTRAGMKIDDLSGAARLEVVLNPVSAEAFAAGAGAPALPGWEAPGRGLKSEKRPRQRGEAPLVVVLDPGHGGIDPGAEVDGMAEKDMMLIFALELKEELVRAGGFDVVLTREDDSFVSLERRVAIAHRMGADLFLSLHADALSEGRAHGATVYTLSDSASDEASAALAERHNRADMLAGIDLSGKDDVVADVLMDLARMETQPRAERLADEIRAAIAARGLPLHSRPLRHAGFSVLKSPDIPSVLLELGFMSSPRDLANLADPSWRAGMAEALREGLDTWRDADAAAADLVRQ